MKRIILKKGEETRIRAGHPWVFDNEVERIVNGKGSDQLAELESGEIADVESSRKEYLGRAFVNPLSKIIARVYSGSKEGVDEGFFKRRIRNAVCARWNYCLTEEPARLVFAEADFLPGLIIDQYVGWPAEDVFALSALSSLDENSSPQSRQEPPLNFDTIKKQLGEPKRWLSVQLLSFGMDMRCGEIVSALEDVLGAVNAIPLDASLQARDEAAVAGSNAAMLGNLEGIVERSAAPVREREGLPLREGVLKGYFPDAGIIVFENGYPFLVNLRTGQKTGHFLDQKENHALCGKFAAHLSTLMNKKIRILDAFCYTGGFAINAARSSDCEIIAVDSSAPALEALKRNADLNGVSEKITCVEDNVFDVLTGYERAKEKFDLIILDPPAFAKSRSALDGAVRGYKEINLKAIKILSPNGILVTCSCSYAMTETQFKSVIADAALDADRRLVQLDFRYQSSDHPILVGYDESQYLKCGYYRVVKA